MTRIIWYSNSPFVGSGYGNQTALFVPRLKALGHDMAIAAYWGIEGAKTEWDGIPVYPKSVTGTLSYDSMGLPAKDFGADIIISLMDLWALAGGVNGDVPLFPWFPIDHEPLPPPIAARLTGPSPLATRGITMSKFGQRMAEKAGIDTFYVPHGVDTKAFAPLDRSEARRALGFPADAFIIGIVAANVGSPGRKALKQQIEAFAALNRKHRDARLHLHTRANASGLGGVAGENLVELVEQLGIMDAVSFTDQTSYHFGLEAEELRALYCSFDVLSNVSMGEGFGIPILEAQACGVPVVVGDWTSMSELCFSGWKLPKERAEPIHTALAAYQWWPSVDGIAEAYEAAYLASDRDVRGLIAAAGAAPYDADYVTEVHWRPVLEQIAETIAPKAPISFAEFTNVAG